MRPASKHPAFSLIEILVVISIIALLLGVLLTTLGKARENAKKIKCSSNMRQISLLIQMYIEDNDNRLILAGQIMKADTKEEALSIWHNALLPYVAKSIDDQDLFKNYTEIWFCPADKDPYPLGFKNFPHNKRLTSYAPNGYYPQKDASDSVPASLRLGPAGGYKIVDVSQPSACMLMGETSYAAQFYDADAPSVASYNLPRDGHHRCTSGFYHSGSMNILYVDGHMGNIKGTKTDTLVWPMGFENQHKSGQYMYWADLSLPNATEDPAFWGPGY